jgi:hypothetical protein
MQKIKDMLRQAQQSSKKIKVNKLQPNFKFFLVKLILMIIFHNVLNLLSLAFYLSVTSEAFFDQRSFSEVGSEVGSEGVLSFLKFMN